MIEDGVLDAGVAGPRVDMALGFHNHPDMPVGRFGFVRGACLAASDRFDITLHGVSGHAAHPYTAVDPIVAAAMLIAQLQTVVSREVKPLHPAVVTVGAIHAGVAYNIIPDTCTFRGTVRTLHAEARQTAELAIRRLCAGMHEGMRVRAEVDYVHGVPSLRNDDTILERSVSSVRAQFGPVVDEGEPSLGGEDFALFAERVPSFQLRVGSGAPGRNDKLHNSGYQPDEACIGLGVQALSRAALDLLA
jgi:amidohydrolase